MTLNITETEARTVLHWFSSWDADEKEKFLALLLEKALPNNVSFLTECLDYLSVHENYPNIFRCQLKLFSIWFDQWTDKERNNFLRKLQEQDYYFVQLFHRRVEEATQNLV